MTVALIKRENQDHPVKVAVELCNGFEGLRPDHKVLVKPNLVLGANKKTIPPFGKVTTSKVMEELLQALVEHGCKDITIGDGAAVMPEIGSNTFSAMKFSGIKRVGIKYGAKLIDFESSTFKKIDMDGHSYKITASALDADFLINVPVLKTHGQAVVSLGMKNLKGCLKYSSKKRFHKKGQLLDLIARLNTHIKSDLTIIDGIFAMEKGPAMGTAHPLNLIIAGKDILETEMVGSAVLGKDPAALRHIQTFTKLTDRRADLEAIDIIGETIASVAVDLPWQSNFNQSFKHFGVKGMQVANHPGDTSICSGCHGNMERAHFMFAHDNPGLVADGVQICIGKDARATTDAKTVFLFGDCAIHKNKDDVRAISVPGCPPDVGQYYPLLINQSLPGGRAKMQLLTRLIKNKAFKAGLYSEDFGLWDPYQSKEFDRSYYE